VSGAGAHGPEANIDPERATASHLCMCMGLSPMATPTGQPAPPPSTPDAAHEPLPSACVGSGRARLRSSGSQQEPGAPLFHPSCTPDLVPSFAKIECCFCIQRESILGSTVFSFCSQRVLFEDRRALISWPHMLPSHAFTQHY
jgi:hypothetical protein